ncbi:hypothetical protein [Pseudoteredinibacter isoporae]|uniref:Cytochrome c domain-containing protein n=1 Tax=Pseudoteredinibacter isoporae TaxID=570281 RepID=A0A7X0MXZ9_9GAMM|nr:hypothetical protein [Pseudoteredinibacter isoporae]MBB6522529.1 hypothetical protein [Pseudoteredinibacter isoporae]NHO88059.1 hypothetical protein [Pseudoteredinibacter isoporae]NIB23610.1 hypothetical protein [Pseudoteredinibacter isoporae]
MNARKLIPLTLFWGARLGLGVLGIAGLGLVISSVTAGSSKPLYQMDAKGLPLIPAEQQVVQRADRLQNPEAVIPPQCYTDTQGQFNPCYTCHQSHEFFKGQTARFNVMNDGSLQGSYEFSDVGVKNHWRNLFEDNQAFIAAISDKAIMDYIAQDNYSSLAGRLKAEGFEGYIPDLKNFAYPEQAFDSDGLAKDGSAWVAFNYKPLPSTFWPTNGNTDDVLIRLPVHFQNLNGVFNRDIYFLNLSLVEMSIKQKQFLDIPPSDETQLRADIDGDGELRGVVTKLAWRSSFFGDAADKATAILQYPLGTEFLHSVRYIGLSGDGEIVTPPRMKELRYMKKHRQLSAGQLKARYIAESVEKDGGELPYYPYTKANGFSNNYGWSLIAWIEDSAGELRQQSYEENLFCMGCHSTVGATIDQTFSFARKQDGVKGWRYLDLRGMPDAPALGQQDGEIAQYLEWVNGGDEFRENQEMLASWFTSEGQLDKKRLKGMDVYQLITPSATRAMALNKAYLKVVREQSYIYGRDAVLKPVKNVLAEVDPETQTPLQESKRRINWDIRLNWPKEAQ